MKKKLLCLSLFTLSLGLVACDTKKAPTETANPVPAQSAEEKPIKEDKQQEIIAAVWVKPYKMDVVNNELCYPETEDEEASCTIYDVQSIKTNLDWLEKYYDDHLHSLYNESAFGKKNDFRLEGEAADRKFYEGSFIRFESQRYNLLTLSQFHNSYSGGAHNIYNTQYDVFDLKTKKKLSLNDVLTPSAKAKVLALIKAQNQESLEEYHTDLATLELTNNFYFGPEGLVFVYAPYEIAAFVYGTVELYVSYDSLSGLLKSEYFPDLPDYSLSADFS